MALPFIIFGDFMRDVIVDDSHPWSIRDREYAPPDEITSRARMGILTTWLFVAYPLYQLYNSWHSRDALSSSVSTKPLTTNVNNSGRRIAKCASTRGSWYAVSVTATATTSGGGDTLATSSTGTFAEDIEKSSVRAVAGVSSTCSSEIRDQSSSTVCASQGIQKSRVPSRERVAVIYDDESEGSSAAAAAGDRRGTILRDLDEFTEYESDEEEERSRSLVIQVNGQSVVHIPVLVRSKSTKLED